jgi:transcriptional regulator with XRE-family HTH domain
MFAGRLVLLRKGKGLSQYKLAKLLNLTRGQIETTNKEKTT